jgi:hypothetical protein
MGRPPVSTTTTVTMASVTPSAGKVPLSRSTADALALTGKAAVRG